MAQFIVESGSVHYRKKAWKEAQKDQCTVERMAQYTVERWLSTL